MVGRMGVLLATLALLAAGLLAPAGAGAHPRFGAGHARAARVHARSSGVHARNAAVHRARAQSAASGNAAATAAFLHSDYAFLQASVRRIHPIQARIERLRRQLAGQCRNAGAGSPQNEQSHLMSYEVAGLFWSVTYGIESGPIHRLAHAVGRLHFGDQALARALHAYLGQLEDLAKLPTPNVCADIAAWRASGWTALPAHVKSFDKQAELEVEPVPAHLLLASAPPAARPLVGKVERLQRKLVQTETLVGGNDWFDTIEMLGLNE